MISDWVTKTNDKATEKNGDADMERPTRDHNASLKEKMPRSKKTLK
jgi:hypothetical protein